jgi:hypothetical protein
VTTDKSSATARSSEALFDQNLIHADLGDELTV